MGVGPALLLAGAAYSHLRIARPARILILCVAILWKTVAPASGQETRQTLKLPEGAVGVAARYPGDVGVAGDASVIFVENFDDGLDAVQARWESVQAAEQLSLSGDAPAGGAGGSSLLVTHVGGSGNGPYLYRRFDKGYDKLFYRFYVKFAEDSGPIHHFFHVGGYNPPTPWPQGGAGERPRGDERFTTGVEPFGDQWQWDLYVYWMRMRGSPPRGQTWGNAFVRDPAVKVTRGAWQCVELMLKVNDLGQSNGEAALWIDGKLVGYFGQGFPKGKWVYDKFLRDQGGQGVRWNDQSGGPEDLTFVPGGEPFEGFQWRSAEDLKLNFLWLLFYITDSPQGHVTRIWMDDVVVAQEYIGPIQPRK